MASRRWLVGGASFVLAAALVGCGADEDPGHSSSGTTSAPANPAAFCEAAVDAEATLSVGSRVNFETATLTAVEDSAPEDISDEVSTLTEKIREWLSTGDDTILEQPEYTSASEAVDEYMLAGCGYERVDATGVDYAYEGIPETLPSGVVAITFSNDGEVSHDLSIVRISDDATESLRELLALPEDQIGQKIAFAGSAFAEPGESDTAFIRLEPGRYGAVCFTREGTTHEAEGSGPPHFTRGMFAEVSVE
jgi:hypothetical protein